jgi:hypothetical protein
MGFVEDERTFSTLSFTKTRLWNYLCEHLDLVVQMFAQPFYTVDTFPYDDAITTWTEEKASRGLLAWCVLDSMLLSKFLVVDFHLILFVWLN